MKRILVLILTCLIVSPVLSQQINPEPEGGGEFKLAQTDYLSDSKRTEIFNYLERNKERLISEGKLDIQKDSKTVLFSWPLQAVAGFPYNSYYFTSGFVDHDPAFPDQLLDYYCGERTYDRTNGYNHKGTDLVLWPFMWYMQYNDLVEVIAAAPGTIIGKEEGHADTNCSFNTLSWNAVYIEHSDGSLVYYGHLQENSVTTKNIGEQVVEGEYLGLVGSSGSSTAPHLHFEVYDDAMQLMDPFSGPCNNLNSSSLWVDQKPYRDPYINALLTHYSPPVFLGCPHEEILNTSDDFLAGDTVFLVAYYRDQIESSTTEYTIYKPSGGILASWSHDSPETYSASYWYWYYIFPQNSETGSYRFEAFYEGNIFNHFFNIGIDTSSDLFMAHDQNFYIIPHSNLNYLDLHIKNSGTGKMYIEIYDALGQKIITKQIPEGSDKTRINLPSVNNGIYIATLIIEDRILGSIKFLF